ncbi:MAG: 2-phospho-L-lactate transferase [Asgard group archaeon]|nr:2-phospho-L-lactate transferase [Asgard group archaeon]
MRKITFLSGGTGTPKLLLGMRKLIPDENLHIIGNTGDDDYFFGLLISPDIDTLLYLFSEKLDLTKFWGVKKETFTLLTQLELLGEETWFKLGDKDLALHLLRNKLLQQGWTLNEAIHEISKRLKIRAKIYPMSNDFIQTKFIDMRENIYSFQEYTVKNRETIQIKEVIYEGSKNAKALPEAINAIMDTSLVIIGPSNPITSIGPMLAISGIKKALIETEAKIIAISPIISNRAFSGPAAKLLQQLGYEATPKAIAEMYQEFLDLMIISEADKHLINGIEKLGVKTLSTNISLKTNDERKKLANKILKEFVD